MTRTTGVALAAVITVGLVASTASAQRRRAVPVQPGQTGAVPLSIALNAGGTSYAFSGQGSCEATPRASIYGKAAALWTVRHQDEGHSVTLTVWHPTAGGPDMMSLGVTLGGKTHQVSTVKVGEQGDVKGSGTVSFQKEGAGGVFKVDAVASDGTKISGTVKCGGFAEPMPVAG